MKFSHYWKLRTHGELKLNFPVSNGKGSNSFAVLAELFPASSAHVRTDGMYKMTWISQGIKDNKTRIPRILYLIQIKDHDKGIHSELYLQ